MDLFLIGVLVAVIAFAYLAKAPAPHGAPLGCAGILLGLLIAIGAIVRMIFF